jgi:hypothetical protein
MDSIDAVFYKDAEMPEELITAYAFFNTDEGKIVLEDLLRYCGWGPQDPTSMNEQDAKSVLAAQRIVWRVKAALNAKPQTKGEDEDE